MVAWKQEAFVALAAKQHGVVSREQLTSKGMTHRQIERRTLSGQWQRVLPCVYRLGGSAESIWQRAWAAVLWAGPDALLSHQLASWIWGFTRKEPRTIELTAPFRLLSTVPWLVVHSSQFPRTMRRIRQELPVTSPARTLVDVAAQLNETELESAMEAAFRTRFVTPAELHHALRLLRCQARNGTALLHQLLQNGSPTRSSQLELEHRAYKLFTRLRLPEPICQFQVLHDGYLLGTVDFAWPKHRLIVEADSFAPENGPDACALPA